MKKITVKSASMLVTKNGFCVKVETETSPITFFVDKNFNQVPWKLTIDKGLILDQREFWRMRREWKLEEISLSETQLPTAIKIAEAIIVDPYIGLTPSDRKRLYLPSHEEMLRKSENDSKADDAAKKRPRNVATAGEKLESVFGNVFQILKEKINADDSPLDKFNKRFKKMKTA